MSVSINSLTEIDRKKIKDGVQAIADSLTRVAAERDLVKEILIDLEEETGVEKKVIRKLGKLFFKSSFDQEAAEFSEIEDLYNLLLKKVGG